jgi:hypothetical protein
LIFPSLFKERGAEDSGGVERSVSLYYDFAGAIDNIYSSLVVSAYRSDRFGRVRMWRDYAEYETPGGGVCAVRKIERKRGLAHLDLLFSPNTAEDTRRLFTVFVEDHLKKEGVNVKEVLGMVCGKCKRYTLGALSRAMNV